jgi:hypothetical protein
MARRKSEWNCNSIYHPTQFRVAQIQRAVLLIASSYKDEGRIRMLGIDEASDSK